MLLDRKARRPKTNCCLTQSSALILGIIVVVVIGGFRSNLKGIVQRAIHNKARMQNSTDNTHDIRRARGVIVAGAGMETDKGVDRPIFIEKRYNSIFYLKMHKTGSTLLARQLSEYLQRHSLRTIKAPGHILVTFPNNLTATNTTTSRNGTTTTTTNLVRADAIVRHHFSFDWEVVLSYLEQPPDLVLTSMRLPLQRQLSWFRQQNRQWDTLNCSMIARNDTSSLTTLGAQSGLLEAFDNFTKNGRMIESQSYFMTERSARSALRGDLRGVLAQFDFVFLKERLVESLECFCKHFDVKLCSSTYPAVRTNFGGADSCVERILFTMRINAFPVQPEDHLLYEIVNQRLSQCQRDIPTHCHCPTA